MPFQDQTLPCQGCGMPFVFTAGEQEFYEKKGFRETPKRCRGCRDARKVGGGGGQAPPPRREPAARPRPQVEAVLPRAATRPGGEPRSPLIDPTREEALRQVVREPDPTPPPHARGPAGRGGAGDDDNIGNRWYGGPRRFGAPVGEDEVDDDIGNRIDVEPRAGMSRGVREALALPYQGAAPLARETRASLPNGGPVELQCVACGTVVRLSAPPPAGRAVFCRGCQ